MIPGLCALPKHNTLVTMYQKFSNAKTVTVSSRASDFMTETGFSRLIKIISVFHHQKIVNFCSENCVLQFLTFSVLIVLNE